VRVLGYGTTAAAAAHPTVPVGAEIVSTSTLADGGTDADVRLADGTTVQVRVRTPGRHMLLNGVASLLAGVLVGASAEGMAAGVASFDGVRRRFEYHGRVGGVEVYDDYAHHPTEVRAVVTAAREKVRAGDTAGGRVVAVFQPHLYSRTLAFAGEFAEALSLADVAVVLDIFGAREEPVEGVDSRVITDRVDRSTTEVHYEPRFADVPARVADLARDGDLVLTVGAGTVTMLADEILRALETTAADEA
jgi:UDP-N-acetylmuramate--alanine ligase